MASVKNLYVYPRVVMILHYIMFSGNHAATYINF